MRLSALYKHRSVWMGIAMLWIVLFHSGLIISNSLISYVREIGYGGVDIFMFASGLGAYFSYTKDHNPTSFIKRRFARLAPVYLLFIAIWISYKLIMSELSIKAAIGNFLAVQGFTGLGYEFNWYITALIVVYILTPFFSGLIEKFNSRQIFFLIAVLIAISIPFWNSHNGIIIVTRLPIFVIGMYFAKLSKDDSKRMTWKFAALLAGAMIVGMALLMLFFVKYSNLLWEYGLYWYPFILITPGLCLLTSAFA